MISSMVRSSPADREKMEVSDDASNQMQTLDIKTQIQLLKQCRQLQQNGLQSKAAQQLQAWIFQQLQS